MDDPVQVFDLLYDLDDHIVRHVGEELLVLDIHICKLGKNLVWDVELVRSDLGRLDWSVGVYGHGGKTLRHVLSRIHLLQLRQVISHDRAVRLVARHFFSR